MAEYVVGIWGCGMVGGSMEILFRQKARGRMEVLCYDKYKDLAWTPPKELMEKSDYVFVCLPTPMQEDGGIDLSYILSALVEMMKVTDEEKTLIIRSTIVPGTANNLSKDFPQFKFAVMPEFLTEDNPLTHIFFPKRIVLGVDDTETYLDIKTMLQIIYPRVDFVKFTPTEAEMYKYACNYFLAMNVLAANELYNICNSIGVEYGKIQQKLYYDSRLGTHNQVPGYDGDFGIGGKCLPKDINALSCLAKHHGYNPELLDEAIRLNERVRVNKDWLKIKGAVSSCGYE